MPFAVDEEKMNEKKRYDVSASPNSPAGLPMKQIPHMEFPRVVYKHPAEPYKTVVHRNALHEVVQQERIPSEHLTRSVANKEELAKALKDGWVTEPYVAKPLPDPNVGLYETK